MVRLVQRGPQPSDVTGGEPDRGERFGRAARPLSAADAPLEEPAE
jgi:hypothetical protein